MLTLTLALTFGCSDTAPSTYESFSQRSRSHPCDPDLGAAIEFLKTKIRQEVVPQLSSYDNYFYHDVRHSQRTADSALAFVRAAHGTEREQWAAYFAGYYHDYINEGETKVMNVTDDTGTYQVSRHVRSGYRNEERSADALELALRAANGAANDIVFEDNLIERAKRAVMSTKVIGFDESSAIVLERDIDDKDIVVEAVAVGDLIHMVSGHLTDWKSDALSIFLEERVDIVEYIKAGKRIDTWETRYKSALDKHLELHLKMILGQHLRLKNLRTSSKHPHMKAAIDMMCPSVATNKVLTGFRIWKERGFPESESLVVQLKSLSELPFDVKSNHNH